MRFKRRLPRRRHIRLRRQERRATAFASGVAVPFTDSTTGDAITCSAAAALLPHAKARRALPAVWGCQLWQLAGRPRAASLLSSTHHPRRALTHCTPCNSHTRRCRSTPTPPRLAPGRSHRTRAPVSRRHPRDQPGAGPSLAFAAAEARTEVPAAFAPFCRERRRDCANDAARASSAMYRPPLIPQNDAPGWLRDLLGEHGDEFVATLREGRPRQVEAHDWCTRGVREATC